MAEPHLATLLGGKIEFDCKLAEGSTFWLDLQLPLWERTASEQFENPQSNAKVTISGARILLVDDTKTCRLIIRALLEAAGGIVVETVHSYL